MCHYAAISNILKVLRTYIELYHWLSDLFDLPMYTSLPFQLGPPLLIQTWNVKADVLPATSSLSHCPVPDDKELSLRNRRIQYLVVMAIENGYCTISDLTYKQNELLLLHQQSLIF